MKRMIVKILLIVVQKLLMMVQLLVGSEISEINFDSYLNITAPKYFEVQFWDRPSIFEWEEYKSCNYADSLTDDIRITYWDIEEDFNTMKGVNYNE